MERGSSARRGHVIGDRQVPCVDANTEGARVASALAHGPEPVRSLPSAARGALIGREQLGRGAGHPLPRPARHEPRGLHVGSPGAQNPMPSTRASSTVTTPPPCRARASSCCRRSPTGCSWHSHLMGIVQPQLRRRPRQGLAVEGTGQKSVVKRNQRERRLDDARAPGCAVQPWWSWRECASKSATAASTRRWPAWRSVEVEMARPQGRSRALQRVHMAMRAQPFRMRRRHGASLTRRSHD